jgi:hypothetical protein
MTKRKNCDICGKYSGKRNVCKDCKEKYPYKAAPTKDKIGMGGGLPFNRKKEYEKDVQRKK